MEKRRFGKTDMDVTVLGFGASEIGYEGASRDTVSKLLNSALDAGLNVIDTAECYPGSEELIGNTVANRRQDYYLFTKCGHPEGYQSADWRPASLLQSIERSLRRLRTKYVDLIQLHSCSEAELRKGDVTAALQKAREKGYTRYIGYSGDSKAALYAIESGAFDTLQTSVSIADQEALDLTLPKARARNMGVIAKRPIANAAWRSGKKPENPYHHIYWERLRELKYGFLGNEQAVSTALRFTLGAPGVHTAIVGTTKAERWQQNAKLLESGPLPQDQFEQIRRRWKEVAGRNWVGQV